jgi:hypothetical protein
MQRSIRTKLVAGVGAVVALAGGGAAIGATQFGSPSEESQAIVNDAANQLGVEPSELTAALKQALENRVDAAVEAGTITEEQGAALKERIAAGDYPILGLRGGGPGHHFGFGRGFGHLDAAANYLGVTETALRTQLADGKTLAEVAEAQNKSVDGLVDALVADEKKALDAAVTAGRLTDAQRDAMLARAEERFEALVNGEGFGFHGFRGPHGPPPADPDDDSAGASFFGGVAA